ncbi:hypothetical protein AWJ14_05265 [Hoeflea olei]|uniref:Amino acid permease n=1 Tax=Hoeflea olei TaxID=1480615 RepID=A0A1C1YZ12_9HYPH|nr:hypothetical protein AWJ14_05265 [Hoeflea olei]
MLEILILASALAVAAVLFSPRVRGVKTWKAMSTPLASIIGSGFLVLGPLLSLSYGKYAPLAMVALCAGAYLYGAAIRYNMAAIEVAEAGGGAEPAAVPRLETASSALLGFAYVISVAYYLNLLGAFGVSLTPFNQPLYAKLLTSAVYGVILAVGWTRGFKSLERMEYVSVTVKLAIIAGLLVGLADYFWGTASAGKLVFNAPTVTGLSALTLAFGLIVTVQGFETSRYLGANYDRRTRVRSMQWAQWVSTAIYMVYIVLTAYVFAAGEVKLSETAIVDMMAVVSPILPAMLVAAALAAQFSAAIADTSGSGGLFAELTANRITPKLAYAGLSAIGLGLTWTANVFEIISYASCAFALYYAVQAAIAMLYARRKRETGRAAGFAALALLGLMIVLFGQAVEA